VRERERRKEARLPQQLQIWRSRAQQEIQRLLQAEGKLEQEREAAAARVADSAAGGQQASVGRVAALVRL
jgi:hypothetical protein